MWPPAPLRGPFEVDLIESREAAKEKANHRVEDADFCTTAVSLIGNVCFKSHLHNGHRVATE